MEEPAISSPQSEPPKLPRMSLAARLMNVFATPGDVFNEVKAFPHVIGNWLIPALLFIMVSWVGSWIVLSQPAIRQQLTEITDKSMDNFVKEGKMSAQDAETMRSRMETGGVVGTAVGPLFAAF